MPRLILMRHAKSDWATGQPDHERPLNRRGRTAATALGQWLRAQGHIPDQAIVSSAQRTFETFEGLDLDLEPQFTRTLYLAEPQTMMAVLHKATGDCVLMIGHNPGIADLAHSLVRRAPAHHGFATYPTGATLVIDFAEPGWGDVRQGVAVDFIVPRDLTD
ncbi:MAG: histidine phosphatase family protein [Rhodobacteraceae bacterium]|nr:histidine phosphatase family protein [Paracoccaceae bacterium]